MKPVKVQIEDGKATFIDAEGNKTTGLGDAIKAVTSAIGIPQCNGCKRRQKKLNKIIPDITFGLMGDK